MPPLTMTLPPKTSHDQENDQPTSFLSLPAELRNYMYELSGCLNILQCRNCHSTIRGDSADILRLCCYQLHLNNEEGCEYRRKAFLWVNRKGVDSSGAVMLRKKTDCAGHISGGYFRPEYPTHSLEDHLKHHVVGASQPALTRASKQIRYETLPIFYGDQHIFMFTLFPGEERFGAGPAWLRTIGENSASMIRQFLAVTPVKQVWPWMTMQEWLVGEIEGLGLTVPWTIMEYPTRLAVTYNYGNVTFRFGVHNTKYCSCETCMLPDEEVEDLEARKD